MRAAVNANKEGRKYQEMKKAKRVLIYTVIYAVMAVLVWRFFPLAGKSLINRSDAYEQHINALIVYGKWIRGIIYNFAHGDFSLPNYSFGIGYGGDFFTSMHYYAVGDILNIPAAFLPTASIYYYFQFLILLRPYLAGLSFMTLYNYKRDHSLMAILAGSLSYAFCGTVLFIGMWNPFFVNAMIIFPVMILGADLVIDEKKPLTFILSVCWSEVTNFYFFYMMVLLIIGYVLVRLCIIRKDVIKIIFSFLLYGILGTALGAFIFLPVVLSFLSNPRVGLGGHSVRAFYDFDYIKELCKNLIAYIYKPKFDTEIAMTAIVIPALVFMIMEVKNRKREVIFAAIMTVMLLIPFAGYAMTGFSYMINRWCFALELLLAVAIADLIDSVYSYSLKKRVILAAITLFYNGLVYMTGYAEDELVQKQMILLLIIAGAIIILPYLGKEKKAWNYALKTCMLLTALFGIYWNAYYAGAPDYGNLPNGYIDKTTGDEFLNEFTQTESKAIIEQMHPNENDFIRYSGRNLKWNSSLIHGVSSTQFYFSLANGAVSDFMEKLAINEMSNFSYKGLDDREIPLAITGTGYYLLPIDNKEEQAYVPIGYSRSDNYYTTAIYENKNINMLGFVTDSCVSSDTFEKMNPVQRQEVLMDYAVTEDTEDAGEFVADYEEADYKIKGGKKTEVDKNAFTALKDNAKVKVKFQGKPNSETYIYFDNLWCDVRDDMVNINLTAYSGDRQVSTKTLSYKTPESEFYSGWHNYIVNMGCDPEGITKVTIELPEEGVYSFDSFKVIMEPMDVVLEKEAALGSRQVQSADLHLNPVSRMTNHVSTELNSEKDGFLVLRIPYEKGWTAYADGEKISLRKADVMLMGFPIKAGEHKIELYYHTPGLLMGFVISLAASAILAALTIKARKTL